MSLYLWIIFGYLVVLTAYNLFRSRKIKSQEDFMVAGRTLGIRILVFTLICTWIGSGTFIAGAEYAAHAGWSSLWLPAGAWLGILFIYFFAAKIRTFGQYTIGDILEVRYGKLARFVGAVMIIIAFTTIVSYQFRAGGLILNIVTGGAVSVGVGQTLAALFVISFTVMGGMIAVAHTDLPNGIIILLACCIALPFVVLFSGGVGSVEQNLPAAHMAVFSKDFGQYPALKAGGYFLATLLLLMGVQSMYQKFYSARSPKEAKQATALWIIGTIIVETVVVAIAVYSAASHWTEIKEFKIISGLQHEVSNQTLSIDQVRERANEMIAELNAEGVLKPEQSLQLTDAIHHDLERISTREDLLKMKAGLDPAAIVLKAAEDISSYSIIGFLAGVLLLGAACAVVISTGMNYLLSPTTNIMRDIYGRFINKDASEPKKIALQKIFVAVLGVFAFLMIFIPTVRGWNVSVLRYSYIAYTMYGVAITPALLAALAWKRATKAGGLTSIIGGSIAALFLELVVPHAFPAVMKDGDPWGIPGIYISFLISIGCLIIVSLLTSPPREEEIANLFPKEM